MPMAFVADEVLKDISCRLIGMYEEDLTKAEKQIVNILILHNYVRIDEEGVVRPYLRQLS